MKLTRHVLLLILVYAMLDMAASMVLHGLSKSSKIRFSRMYYQKMDADLLILGNSRAVNLLYTPELNRKLGIRAVNLGYNGLTLPVISIILDDYLDLHSPPGRVILEVSSVEMKNRPLLNLRQYFPDSARIRKAIRVAYPEVYYARFIARSHIFNSEFFLRSLYYLNHNDESWIMRRSITAELYEALRKEGKHPEFLDKVSDESVATLRKIIESGRRHGVEVTLLLAPILDVVRNDAVVAAFIERIEEGTGVEVVDLSAAIEDTRLFGDSIHINQRGARVLAERLIERGVLPAPARQHRPGDAYEAGPEAMTP